MRWMLVPPYVFGKPHLRSHLGLELSLWNFRLCCEPLIGMNNFNPPSIIEGLDLELSPVTEEVR